MRRNLIIVVARLSVLFVILATLWKELAGPLEPDERLVSLVAESLDRRGQ